MKEVIIDVREKEEFTSEHIEGSINIPLSDLNRQAPGILKNLGGCSITLMCRSGKRAGLAKQQLEAMGQGDHFKIYEGGILEWKKNSKPTACSGPAVFPIMRQVQLIAGLLVLLGAVLSWNVDPHWILLSGAVGLGLTIAGATGFCGMATVLGMMPWNKCK